MLKKMISAIGLYISIMGWSLFFIALFVVCYIALGLLEAMLYYIIVAFLVHGFQYAWIKNNREPDKLWTKYADIQSQGFAVIGTIILAVFWLALVFLIDHMDQLAV